MKKVLLVLVALVGMTVPAKACDYGVASFPAFATPSYAFSAVGYPVFSAVPSYSVPFSASASIFAPGSGCGTCSPAVPAVSSFSAPRALVSAPAFSFSGGVVRNRVVFGSSVLAVPVVRQRFLNVRVVRAVVPVRVARVAVRQRVVVRQRAVAVRVAPRVAVRGRSLTARRSVGRIGAGRVNVRIGGARIGVRRR